MPNLTPAEAQRLRAKFEKKRDHCLAVAARHTEGDRWHRRATNEANVYQKKLIAIDAGEHPSKWGDFKLNGERYE